MSQDFFSLLNRFEDFIWIYLGVPLIVLLGFYLSLQSGFFQIRKFPDVLRTFVSFFKDRNSKNCGVHPLKAFFASVGGCVGVGNIVSICTAVQIGGPGALFWIWVTSIIGGMLKYAEVYLGMRYRVTNPECGFSGGPMYVMQRLFKKSWMPNIAAILLCIYGVEIYQFNVVIESISTNLEINTFVVAPILLGLVMFAGAGGIGRVGAISSAIIPIFCVLYVSMGLWVFAHHIDQLPHILSDVFVGAFTGHAAVGGFVGSSLMTTISQGVRRGCYASDIGAGYASVIYSESSVKVIEQQAALVLFDIFLDTFIICTTSIALILSTNVWQEKLDASLLVQTALGQYFPYMHLFMPFFIFMLGYSTINAFFCVGLKAADYLAPGKGRAFYYAYAVGMFTIFTFAGTAQAQTVMTIAGGMLLILNCYATFRLRHEISYNFSYVKPIDAVEAIEA